MIDCTVVVATYNRRRLLDATLTRLCALPEAPHVIVVDNGSDDGTAEFALARYPGVQLISLPSNIGAAARTVGVRAAAARYVAFCDDDCWWQPGSLARAVQLLDAHPDVALLNARVVVHQSWIDPACDLMASSGLPKRTEFKPLPSRQTARMLLPWLPPSSAPLKSWEELIFSSTAQECWRLAPLMISNWRILIGPWQST